MLASLGVALAQGHQGGNRRIVDKAQVTAIQCDLGRVVGRVELIQKRRGRGEEQRAMQPIELAAIGLQVFIGVQFPRLLPGEVQRGDDDTAQYGGGQIGEHRNDRHRHDHQHIIERHLVDHPQRRPGEGLLRHHEHHAHQRRQRDPLDQWRQKQNEQ